MSTLEIIVSVGGAVLAATAGVFVTMWYQRSKPWLGLNSISRDDRHLVPVPKELRSAASSNLWAMDALPSHAPLLRLRQYNIKVASAIEPCKRTIDSLQGVEERLRKGVSTIPDQIRLIDDLLSDDFIPQILTSMHSRGVLPLPETVDFSTTTTPVVRVDELTQADVTEKGLIVYGGAGVHTIRAGTGLMGPEAVRRTRVLGQIFQFFITSHLQAMAAAMRTELQRDYQNLLDIRERLNDLIHARSLVVKAQIVNTGGAPVHIEPFALLRIKSSGRPVTPLVVAVQGVRLFEPGVEDFDRVIELVEGMARKQQIESARTPAEYRETPEFVVVSPGQLVQVELVTVDPVEDESIVDALEKGILACQLIVKRSDARFYPWLESKELVMGTRLGVKKREELMARA